jgi:hypothetical protein
VLVAAGLEVAPRVALARLVAAARATPDQKTLGVIADKGDAEPVLALMDLDEQLHLPTTREALRHGVEVFAPALSRDDRVLARLGQWLAKSRELARTAHYLLLELESPRYEDAASARARKNEGYLVPGFRYDHGTPEGLEALELELVTGKRLIGDALLGKVPAVVRADLRTDRQDPVKALRAWAALDGLAVREDSRTLEVYRP